MLVFFLRHAEAEDEVTTDFARQLTSKGLDQADKVGKFCVRYGLIPDVIVTSPVVRAEQTARSVSRRLDDRDVVVERWLACGMTPDAFFAGLGAYAKFDHVMVVGHEPDFSSTVAASIDLSSSDALTIRKASLTAVNFTRLRAGAGTLEFTLPVRLM